jgi:hypothetical protein
MLPNGETVMNEVITMDLCLKQLKIRCLQGNRVSIRSRRPIKSIDYDCLHSKDIIVIYVIYAIINNIKEYHGNN